MEIETQHKAAKYWHWVLIELALYFGIMLVISILFYLSTKNDIEPAYGAEIIFIIPTLIFAAAFIFSFSSGMYYSFLEKFIGSWNLISKFFIILTFWLIIYILITSLIQIGFFKFLFFSKLLRNI